MGWSCFAVSCFSVNSSLLMIFLSEIGLFWSCLALTTVLSPTLRAAIYVEPSIDSLVCELSNDEI